MAKTNNQWITYTFPEFDEASSKWLVKKQDGGKSGPVLDTYKFDTKEQGEAFVMNKALGKDVLPIRPPYKQELFIKKNPESDETTEEREQNFNDFAQQVLELAEECGYSDFLVSVRNSEKPVLYSTAIYTDRAKVAFDLRDNAFALAKEFVNSMMPTDKFFSHGE